MNAIVAIIKSQHHPQNQIFSTVPAEVLKKEAGVSDEDLNQQWEEIEADLQAEGLVMYPALPDTGEDEIVRIFRTNTVISRLLQEVLFPTASGGAFVAQASSALTRQLNHRQ